MKSKKFIAILVTVCMMFSLLPTTALAYAPVSAGSYEELLEALDIIGDGETITLTANITGDPININLVNKTFIIDKTTSKYSYPALAGSYTTSSNCYTTVGYGVAGVTLTHNKTTSGNIDTFTYTTISDSTITAYVSREAINSGSTVYACTDMATALSKITSPYYIYLHLNQNFTGTASTTKTTAFTLLPEGFEATGTINYNGTSPYEAIMTPIMDTDNIGVSFKYISITVQNGEVTRNFGAAEIAEATAYANDCAGDTTMTIVGSVSISVPAVLDSDVQLAIPNGKTLTLSAPLTVNGMFTNNGTVAFKNSGKLTIPTSATLGTYTVPNANYELTTSTSEDNVTYGISAEANGEVSLLRGVDTEPLYYGTLAEAIADTKADTDETIRLRKNVTAASAQGIGANVDVIDLNGFTLSTAAGSYFNASRGNVTFRDSSDAKTGKVTGGSSSYGLFNLAYSGNITFESGTFEDTGGLTAVAAFGRAPNGTVISVERDATIASTGYGVIVNSAATNANYSDTTVNIFGTVQGDDAGITVNGNVTTSTTPVINIYDGSVVSGIYAAGYGTWNISGGIISNETGIYVKSGELNISGGSISGTGAYAEPAYNGNGFNHTGDAIIIDSCGYPGGAPSVTISDGFFVSSNAYALRHMMTQGATPAQSLLISGGNFTGLEEGSVTSDGPTGFISGGMYDGAPSEALIATGYQYNSSTKHIVPVSSAGAAASIGDVEYPSLAMAVNVAKYGEIIALLSDNTQEAELIVSKVITIRSNGYAIGNVSAGEGYVSVFDGPGLIFSISPIATTVVSVAVESKIGSKEVLQEDIQRIAEVINRTQISGISDALSSDGKDQILAAAEVNPDTVGQVAVEINVTVTAIESNLDEGLLVFTVVPTANVYLNGAIQNDTPIPLSNSYLDGSAIEVLLPLPTGFAPEEIVHRSSDGTSERFLESVAYPSAVKKFEIATISSHPFAKLTITKFSTFEMLGEASYAASIGATNYNTLQEAIDAATSGQAIALLQDCSESVNISGKSLVIERGVFDFDKSNITLGENCTLEESGTTLTITYVEPLTVTLLDIADAIAPINGGTPATVIAETDQYTGTVTWAGSPSQFSHSQTYTATITLTAKSGYNFEGIDANAFNVPCAMSATNGADSGVVTATFISPPEGYITDGNGTMAYCFNNFFEVYYNFDIMGFFHNGWKQTTYWNFGYGTQYKIGDSELTDIYATGEPLAMGSSGLTLDVDLVFVSEGKALQVVYTVHNTGTENVSFSFGSHADTQIGYTDWAPISIFDLNLASASLDRGFKMVSTSGNDANDEADYAQFNFFGKRSVGVTDVDSFWYGGYWERNSNVFTQVDATSYIGDSGMAYSWQNRTIGTGETQTYKVIIGIGGAESADVLGYSVAYDDNVPDTVIAVPETQQKLENIALTISEQIPVRSGFEFDSWNTQADGNGMVYHPGDTYAPNASITLYAQWTEVPTNNFSVTVTADPSGSIFVGDTVTLTATVTSATVPSINVMNRFSIMSPADPPSDLTYQWYRNTTDSATGGNEIPGAASSTYQPSTATVGTTYYYCVVNDVTSNVVGVTVTSVPVITYTITATAGANGSISPSGLVTVSNGGFQQFTITPNTGYYITDVRVDGLSVGAVSSYTFSNITANHTITASFAHNDDDELDDIPKTGEVGISSIWWVLLAVSGAGIFVLALNWKKTSKRR